MNRDLQSEKERLLKAIEALEEQRSVLGSDVVDTALTPLRQKLKSLNAAPPLNRQLRKNATVVFADISGFTEICGDLDAEYVTGILNSLWKNLDGVILQHGGIIDKHMGDAVMALWGAERVRENDTELAIRAALKMQESSKKLLEEQNEELPAFRMRIAVHTGPVFISGVGLKNEYTAMGDTVNIASRLQSAAPLGSVIVSRSAYRRARDSFLFRSMPPLKVKGAREPLTVYLAEEAASAFQQINTGILGIRTTMVGRDEEMEELTFILKKAFGQDRPEMVTVVGEAGVGKSRLLHEFRRRIEGEWADTIFFNARCNPEMVNIPCSVFRDILRYRFRIMEDDPQETVLKKCLAGMDGVLDHDRIVLACHYSGFDLSSQEAVIRLKDSPALAMEGQAGLVEYFRATAAENRTLLYLEDLHWADSTSLDLILKLASHIHRGKLLILALTRPPLLKRRSAWKDNNPGRMIRLKPLKPEHSRRLLREILVRVDDLPEDLAARIISDSEGNPFYLEELIAMMVEEGIILRGNDRWTVHMEKAGRRKLPSTLSGVLQARLDSLPESEQRLLQRASVIGRIFWDRALLSLYEDDSRDMIETGLNSVRSRDLVHRQSLSTFSTSAEYLFKHAILRDVTYDTVLLELRRKLHNSIAEWLVDNGGDRREEFAGLIAEHYRRGDNRPLACSWLFRAGRAAYTTGAFSEALGAYESALQILPRECTDPPPADLHLWIARSLEKLARYREAEKHLEQSLKLCRDDADHRVRSEALLVLAWIKILRGDLKKAEEISRRAYDQALRSGDRAVQARANMRMADFDPDRSYDNLIEYYRRSLNTYRDLEFSPGIAITYLNMGNMALAQGRAGEASDFYEKSLEAYRAMGDKWGIANCLGNMGNIALDTGNFEESRDLHMQSLSISSEIGDGEGEVICNLNLGRDQCGLGNFTEGLEHHLTAMKKGIELGLVPLALGAVAEISQRMMDEKRFVCAAWALLCVQKNQDAYIPEGEGLDVKNQLSEAKARLGQEEWNRLTESADSMDLPQMTQELQRMIRKSRKDPEC